jgi:hypothetical protein
MARRGVEDGREVIFVLVLAALLFIGNVSIDQILTPNPNHPPQLDGPTIPNMPHVCSGILIFLILVIVLNWFREKRD